ncbi:hypothetical protein Tco_1023744 [Tanacetum coccineum]
MKHMTGKEFAYSGEKILFTIGALSRNKEFTVVLDDVTSNRNNGNVSPENHGRFGRALVGLRRNLGWGCLLARKSFFHNDVRNFADVGWRTSKKQATRYNGDKNLFTVLRLPQKN